MTNKRQCTASSINILSQGGLFLIMDRIQLPDEALHPDCADMWDWLERKTDYPGGTTGEEFLDKFQHKHDHPAGLEEHLRWLRESGFTGACLHLALNRALWVRVKVWEKHWRRKDEVPHGLQRRHHRRTVTESFWPQTENHEETIGLIPNKFVTQINQNAFLSAICKLNAHATDQVGQSHDIWKAMNILPGKLTVHLTMKRPPCKKGLGKVSKSFKNA